MSTIFTRTWWAAAGRRAAYTALAALLGVIGPLSTGSMPPLAGGSIVALAVVLSLAWSLKSLPEVDAEPQPWWKAVLLRVLRTVGQTAVPALTTVTLFQDVDWRDLGVTVGGAAATTLIRTLMTYPFVDGLPEDWAPGPHTVSGVRSTVPGVSVNAVPADYGPLPPAVDGHEVDATPPPDGYQPRHRREPEA